MGSATIYEDLNDLPLDEKVLKLEDKNVQLLDHIKRLENDISKLCKELTQMKDKESTLKKNISELYNTAKLENERNQRRITELQKEVDDFRLRRHRQPINDDRKRTSTRKDEEIETKKIKLDDYRNRDYKHTKSIDRYDRFRADRERSNSTDRRRSRDREYYNHKTGRRPDRGRRFIDEKKERNVKVGTSNYLGDNLKIEIKNERARRSENGKEDKKLDSVECVNITTTLDSQSKHKMDSISPDEVKDTFVQNKSDILNGEVSLSANANRRRRCVIKMVN
ncbi:hypothetical protein RI129_005004 [Pyrocoelia pectoralis]|uniref:Uncharacterized protein n=1 Tax=Pyrocoelia pectoralis TaxID=417401 RepID=A0AAN7VDD2_9COLE